MMDIKKFAAGVIAGAAITAAPLMAFAAPASAATRCVRSGRLRQHPTARAFSGAAQSNFGGGSSFAHTSHCGGGMHCDECGC